MRYKSGKDFRQALETRLRNESIRTGAPLVRLRKTTAFERLLARLANAQPERWVLKGGLALQSHLTFEFMESKQIDLPFSHNLGILGAPFLQFKFLGEHYGSLFWYFSVFFGNYRYSWLP